MRLESGLFYYPSPNGLDFSGEINSNSIVLKDSKLVLIDPGLHSRWEELKDKMAKDGLDPYQIDLVLLTHSHPDHMEAASVVQKETGAKVVISQIELQFLRGAGLIFFENFKLPETSMEFLQISEGPFSFGNFNFNLYLTPGHCPGSICIHYPKESLLVTGDLYFQGTIGAIHLTGGQPSLMYQSVKRMWDLDDITLVICGHGDSISGRQKVLENYTLLWQEIEEKIAANII
jgi:glyoxylase-like metal-dependent hydrolase (beta-lactamase superfamily II)